MRDNNNNNNNNLPLITVKTNHSTLHTVYNIQQSATQGSNDTTHRLSHRTPGTTTGYPEVSERTSVSEMANFTHQM